MPVDLLDRVVVPSRIALIYRDGQTLGYNPALNVWHRLDEACAEVLRWLRAGRDRDPLEAHLARRFDYTPAAASKRLQEIARWCVLRRLLYLDREPPLHKLAHPPDPLAAVYWICTQGCNLRCTYCYQEALVARPNELSTAEAKDLVDQVVESEAATFVITGGEPFTRRDLLEVARYSKSRGLRTNVITNGQYIRQKNVEEVARVFDRVTVSLDHGLPEHHDRHRGPGSWKRALNAIDLLIEAGVQVDVNSVLTKLGLRDVKELLQLIRSRRIGTHRITPQFPMGRGANSRDDQLTPTELLQVDEHLTKAGQNLDGHGPRLTQEGAYTQKGMLRNHCGAGLSEVSVDPEGWVYPCRLLQYPKLRSQNIREARLVDIFDKDPLLRWNRGRTADTVHPCKTCIIKNQCGGGCRGIHMSLSEEYLEPHPMFCAYLRRGFEAEAWSSTGSVPAARKAKFHKSPDEPAHRGQTSPLAASKGTPQLQLVPLTKK